jgi:hypothetical protein
LNVVGIAEGDVRLAENRTPTCAITTIPVSIPTRTPTGSRPAGPTDGLRVARGDALDLKPCEHRTFGVVLVCVGSAEQPEDAIAGDVLHGSPESLDDLTESPDRSADDFDDVFRVEFRRESGRPATSAKRAVTARRPPGIGPS